MRRSAAPDLQLRRELFSIDETHSYCTELRLALGVTSKRREGPEESVWDTFENGHARCLNMLGSRFDCDGTRAEDKSQPEELRLADSKDHHAEGMVKRGRIAQEQFD